MVNYSCWIMMRCYLFACIFFIHIFLIDTSTWLCINFFLQINEFIWWKFGMNVDTSKVLISYNIITVVCISFIFFSNVDMWGNINTSPLLIIVWNILSLFPSWRRKWHYNYFTFVMNFLSIILIKLEDWEDIQCHEHQVPI